MRRISVFCTTLVLVSAPSFAEIAPVEDMASPAEALANSSEAVDSPPTENRPSKVGGVDMPILTGGAGDKPEVHTLPVQATPISARPTDDPVPHLQELMDVNRLAKAQAEAEAQAAEVVRQKTLEAAERSSNAMQTRLLNRLANAKSIQVEISSSRARLFRETQRDLESVRRELDRVNQKHAAQEALTPGSKEVDAAFLTSSANEAEALDRAQSAFRRKDAFSPAKDSLRAFDQDLREEQRVLSSLFRSDDLPSIRETMTVLEQERARLENEAKRLKEDARYRFFLLAMQRMEVAKLHHQQRIRLLPKVSEALSRQLHGFHEDALEQGKLVLRFQWMTLSFHVQKRIFELIQLPEREQGIFRWGAVVGNWLLALMTTLLGAWGWRKAPSLYRKAQQIVVNKSKTMGRARLWEGMFRWISLLAPRGFLLLYVQIVYNELKNSSPRPELDLAAQVTQWFIAYQLVTELTCRFILRVSERKRLLDDDLKLRAIATIRRILRSAFIVVLSHQMALRFLGDGVAMALVRNLLLVGCLSLLVSIMRQWRADIAQAYLRGWPESRLAEAVRSADAHWYGFFVSTAAFAFVMSKALYGVGSDFVLGFEHTRRALAYLFRLQIERSARERPPRRFDVSALPQPVLEVFAGDETAAEKNFAAGWLVNEFPRLEQVSKELLEPGTSAGIYWLHAPYGMGRSTWLKKLQADLTPTRNCHLLAPKSRMRSAEQMFAWFGEQLALGPVRSVSDFANAFDARETSVILLDGLEWCFLRTIGGYSALDTLLEMARATRGKVEWVWSVPEPTHRHLMYAKRISELVGTAIELTAWSESSIRELIHIRQKETGYSVSFEDLLIRDVEQIEISAQVVKNEEQYIRLLWNFAQGNPTTAQHFWLRSLVAGEDGALHVNLYDVPSVEELEGFPESDRYVMSTFVLHRCLGIEDAALTCSMNFRNVEAHVRRGMSVGMYRPVPGTEEQYAIETHYWEAVRRFLQRKNLL